MLKSQLSTNVPCFCSARDWDQGLEYAPQHSTNWAPFPAPGKTLLQTLVCVSYKPLFVCTNSIHCTRSCIHFLPRHSETTASRLEDFPTGNVRWRFPRGFPWLVAVWSGFLSWSGAFHALVWQPSSPYQVLAGMSLKILFRAWLVPFSLCLCTERDIAFTMSSIPAHGKPRLFPAVKPSWNHSWNQTRLTGSFSQETFELLGITAGSV